jgi:hypothetical protein
MPKEKNTINADDIADKLMNYFGRDVYEVKSQYVKGQLSEYKSPSEFPTVIDFCKQNNIKYQSLMQMLDVKNRKRYLKLQNAYEFVKKIQEKFILQNALTGRYNPVFSIFAMKNLAGWRDGQDLNLNTKNWANIAKKTKLK